jgi:anti-sigma B factor antagonist
MLDEPKDNAVSGQARKFRIAVDRTAGTTRVRVYGELDLTTAPRLRHVLDGLSGQTDHVVLDLDRLDFIDSTGVAAIVHADLLANHNGQHLTIRCHSHQAQRVFEITGLRDQLTFDE